MFAAHLLMVWGVVDGGVNAVGNEGTITLWSVEGERAAAAAAEAATPAKIATEPQSQRSILKRLPTPSVLSVRSDVGLTVENRFVTGAQMTPEIPASTAKPDWSAPAETLEISPQVPRRQVTTAPSTRSSRVKTEVVDHLSALDPPPPPMLGVRPGTESMKRSEPVVSAPATPEPTQPSDDRESDGFPRWSMDEQAAQFASSAITTPELEDITPIRPEFTDDQQPPAAQLALPAARPVLPNTPTVARINDQVVPAVRKAYSLAQRGALFAARSEFLDVLRRIAQAKDAEFGTNQHARALADGLRALDEADDFVPVGVRLEADLDVRSLSRSHRTPVLHDGSARALPHDAVARYHAFAQQHLAAAVAGEQAGSMALYGLGRIHIRMAETTDDDLQSVRKSMTMYQAALAAHPGNHLAANELGVLLAQGGHHVDAVAMLQRAIRIAPTATAFQNLAVVQRKLGDQRQAAASDTEAARLAHWERSVGAVSRRLGVEWVSPEHMARMSTPSERPAPQLAASPQGPRPSAAPQPPKTASKLRWPWQRGEEQTPTPGPTRRVARRPQPTSSGTPQRPQMDPIQSNTVWR